MTAESRPAAVDLRPALRLAYLTAFDSFAVQPGDCEAAVPALLRRLESDGLLCSMHVNDEKALTFQCNETYDSISRSTALRRFNATYPSGQPVYPLKPKAKPVPNGHKGATGPRYTEEQITEALTMRADGASWSKIGKAVGIKSTGYLAAKLGPLVAEFKATEPAAQKSAKV